MTFGRHIRFLIIVAAVAIAGCAPARMIPPQVDADGFPVQAATETFAVGYSNIEKKYIDPVSIGDLAVEGMRGLGAIDPALSVRREGNSVLLASVGDEVARFEVPDDADADAWASVTVEVSRAGRTVSPEMNDATVEDIYEAVFDGVLTKLDRFSRYAGRNDAKRNRARRQGFGGIGIRFKAAKDKVRITEIMEDTPAQRAGLKANDLVISIDGVPVKGLDTKELVTRLRGPVETKVILMVRRDRMTEPMRFELERAHVIPSTVSERTDDGILILKVSRFNQATSRSLSRKIENARLAHGGALKGIVLDLRGNPGGLLKQAILSADLFLTQGEIVRTRGRHRDSIQFYQARGSDVSKGLPLVVLVDGKSASAAEITAAALQDRGRAIVIGTTSFGKGSVQTVVRLPNDGEITLTWSRFVAPSGYILHRLGVHPTICTSGITAKSADPIDGFLRQKDQGADVISAWRNVTFADETRRNELRASCPAERRTVSRDVEFARRLIENTDLYSRFLGFSNTAAAAAHP
ncbi:MAG: PDZ domain-containing protein [Rhodospirillales bacterium]|nr:PDZ domain-containing protein [Rhodospirillales bacterium]